MKIFVLILLFLLIVGLAYLPFLLPSKEIHESLSISANLIGNIASLITLLIAILLYSKYGVEKSVLKIQTETVLSFLVELKKTRIWCHSDHAGLQLRLDNLHANYWKKFKNEKLLFDGGYAEGLNNIWELADDVFLPVEIVEKIRPLTVETIIGKQKEDKYMQVIIPGYSQESKKHHFFGLLNGKVITVEEFAILWIQVIKTTKKWLKKHSSIKVDLNFQN